MTERSSIFFLPTFSLLLSLSVLQFPLLSFRPHFIFGPCGSLALVIVQETSLGSIATAVDVLHRLRFLQVEAAVSPHAAIELVQRLLFAACVNALASIMLLRGALVADCLEGRACDMLTELWSNKRRRNCRACVTHLLILLASLSSLVNLSF